MREAMREARQLLRPIYGREETEALLRDAFHYLKGWSRTDMAIHEADTLSDYTRGRLADSCRRLAEHEPIQYITGEAYFYGMWLRVEPGVLIPRPETEDLIDLIVEQNKRVDLRVLDIGTGSGAIAIALARNLGFSRVEALDVDAVALRVAEENARRLHAKVSFIDADIFDWTPPERTLDIIVSNPPYIDRSESAGMEANVLDYEPHHALFVPDSDPLRFYSRIAAVGLSALRPGGKIYFEINPRHAAEMRELLSANYCDVEIRRDRFGRERIATCTLPADASKE